MTKALVPQFLRSGPAKLAGAGMIAAMGLIAAQPALADDHSDHGNTEMSEGEQRLSRMLEGRVAGEPRSCIRSLPTQQLTVIDETAYVYGRGNTIYVQRTRNPEDIDRNETLVSRRFGGSQLCRQDIINTVDPVLGFFTGAVFFDDFIPYTRVRDEDEG